MKEKKKNVIYAQQSLWHTMGGVLKLEQKKKSGPSLTIIAQQNCIWANRFQNIRSARSCSLAECDYVKTAVQCSHHEERAAHQLL